MSTNFKNLQLKGKGFEKTDLDVILSKMEHWAHRLFPKLPFDDCIEQVAKLGNNRSVQVNTNIFIDLVFFSISCSTGFLFFTVVYEKFSK